MAVEDVPEVKAETVVAPVASATVAFCTVVPAPAAIDDWDIQVIIVDEFILDYATLRQARIVY